MVVYDIRPDTLNPNTDWIQILMTLNPIDIGFRCIFIFEILYLNSDQRCKNLQNKFSSKI